MAHSDIIAVAICLGLAVAPYLVAKGRPLARFILRRNDREAEMNRFERWVRGGWKQDWDISLFYLMWILIVGLGCWVYLLYTHQPAVDKPPVVVVGERERAEALDEPRYQVFYKRGGRADGYVHRIEVSPNFAYGPWEPCLICIPTNEAAKVKPDVRFGFHGADYYKLRWFPNSVDTGDGWTVQGSNEEKLDGKGSMFLLCSHMPTKIRIGLDADGKDHIVDMKDVLTVSEQKLSHNDASRFADTDTFETLTNGNKGNETSLYFAVGTYLSGGKTYFDVVVYAPADKPFSPFHAAIPNSEFKRCDPYVAYGPIDKPPHPDSAMLARIGESEDKQYWVVQGYPNCCPISGASALHLIYSELPTTIIFNRDKGITLDPAVFRAEHLDKP